MSEEKCVCEKCSSDCSCKETNPAEVKDSWMWIKDSQGYGSVTVTFTTIAFWVTTLAYILSMVEKVGPVSIRPFDVAACSTYFLPILCLYFGRKATEAKFDADVLKNKQLTIVIHHTLNFE